MDRKIRWETLAAALLILGGILGWAEVRYAAIQQQFSTYDSDMKLLRLRADLMDARFDKQQSEERQSAIDARTKLEAISQQIADLRTLVAAKK